MSLIAHTAVGLAGSCNAAVDFRSHSYWRKANGEGKWCHSFLFRQCPQLASSISPLWAPGRPGRGWGRCDGRTQSLRRGTRSVLAIPCLVHVQVIGLLQQSLEALKLIARDQDIGLAGPRINQPGGCGPASRACCYCSVSSIMLASCPASYQTRPWPDRVPLRVATNTMKAAATTRSTKVGLQRWLGSFLSRPYLRSDQQEVHAV